MRFRATNRLDKIFEVGILLKGLDGLLEVAGGVLLLRYENTATGHVRTGGVTDPRLLWWGNLDVWRGPFTANAQERRLRSVADIRCEAGCGCVKGWLR